MVHAGRCHCGAIGFAFTTETRPGAWSVRACQCTFCRGHGALAAADPNGSLEFFAHEPPYLSRYRFGLRMADFLVCSRCGVFVGATTGQHGIININALIVRPDVLLAPNPVSYDVESEDDRTFRRARRWTPIEGTI